jgi:hypothetical protein
MTAPRGREPRSAAWATERGRHREYRESRRQRLRECKVKRTRNLIKLGTRVDFDIIIVCFKPV